MTFCISRENWYWRPFKINSAATLHLWSPSSAVWPSSSPRLPCTPGAAPCLSPDPSVDHKSLGRWGCTAATGSYRWRAGGNRRRLGCGGCWTCRWWGGWPGSSGPSSAGPRAGMCLWPETLSRSCGEAKRATEDRKQTRRRKITPDRSKNDRKLPKCIILLWINELMGQTGRSKRSSVI